MLSDAGASVKQRGEVDWYVDQRLIIGEGGGRSEAMMQGSTSTLGTPISHNYFPPTFDVPIFARACTAAVFHASSILHEYFGGGENGHVPGGFP
jgi:hypothetical protein